MQLTVAAWDDRVFPVQLDDNEPIDTLKAILEAESGLAAPQQQLLHQGRALPLNASGQPLSAFGIADGDVLMLLPMQQQAAAGGQRQQQGGQHHYQQQQQRSDPNLELADDGSAKVPAAFIQAIRGKPEMMAAVQQGNPALARAVQNEDIVAMQEELRHVRRQQIETQATLHREQELLQADPFDPEVQRKIEELIQKKNIEENLAAALEHNPEVFGSVEMLYVDMEVNGVPVKAFVDSGAQMTIMTHEFADKCYLTRLLDKRFAGMAVGVGSSRILGRIHQAPLKVAGHFTTCSITVLEQREGPQFIFGLDMLKRHQCVLDLAQGELRFGSCDATLYFLPEHQIPKDFKRHIEEVSKQQAERNVEDAAKAEAAGGASTSGAVAGGSNSNAAGSNPTRMDTNPARSAGAGHADAPGGGNAAGTHQSPAAAAAAVPRAAAAPQGGSSAQAWVDESAVQQLIRLGFPREVAVRALLASNGNVDAAASMLFEM